MPELRNCRRCKRIFMHAVGPQICEDCKKLEEEEFERVRKFVREYPGATIQEVSEATEVPTQLIYKFLKDGRLEVSEASPIALQCENCGVRITSGRFCVSCSKKLASDMMRAGKTLRDTLGQKPGDKSRDDKDVGLRYMHEYKRE
jgi:flagellar operon protein (TIGR03826 family)